MQEAKKTKKIAFIINPISGSINKRSTTQLIKDVLSQNDKVSYEIILWSSPEQRHEISKKIKESNYDIAVAVGGDGTINQVAQAVVNTNTALGIIPMGSGNGFARHLGIPLNTKKALDIILNGKQIEIDSGQIDGHLFLCTCGVGFDALIGNLFATSKSRGFFTYCKLTLGALKNYRPEEYEITIDDKPIHEKAFLVTIANASQYGNNAYIAPTAKINDGILNVTLIKQFPFWKIPSIAIKMFNKKIASSAYVNTYQAKKVILQRKQPGPLHYDGEPLSGKRTVFAEIFSKSLKVVVDGKNNHLRDN